MNAFQIKQFQKKYHQWNRTIHSFDFRKTPKELQRAYVSADEFQIFLELPFSRTDDGIILVNEGLSNWVLAKDLLLALDRLPDSLLLDIYRGEQKRYLGIDVDDFSDCDNDNDEMTRRIIYKLLPEIVWAHGNQIEK